MYKIIGIYKGKSEVLDETNNLENAQFLAIEYKLAYGSDWDIQILKGGN